MTDLNSNDRQIAAEFVDAIANGHYVAATSVLVNISNADNPDLAATLLQTLVEALVMTIHPRRPIPAVTETSPPRSTAAVRGAGQEHLPCRGPSYPQALSAATTAAAGSVRCLHERRSCRQIHALGGDAR